MVYEIVWTAKATESYIDNINYLEREWTQKEIANFITSVEKTIKVLSSQPLVGSLRNKKHNIRHTVVNKRISLLYRIKSHNRQIELILFWNTYQNPQRLKKFI